MCAASKNVIPQHRTDPQTASNADGNVEGDNDRWRQMIQGISSEIITGRTLGLQLLVMLEKHAAPADSVHSPSRGAGHANSAKPDQVPLTLTSPRLEVVATRFAGRVRRT